MTREKAIEAIKEFPQEFRLEELFERLLFIDSIEKGFDQIKQGKTVPHEDVMAMIQQWKKSNGQS
jgi:predicted transcriptional regulator